MKLEALASCWRGRCRRCNAEREAALCWRCSRWGAAAAAACTAGGARARARLLPVPDRLLHWLVPVLARLEAPVPVRACCCLRSPARGERVAARRAAVLVRRGLGQRTGTAAVLRVVLPVVVAAPVDVGVAVKLLSMLMSMSLWPQPQWQHEPPMPRPHHAEAEGDKRVSRWGRRRVVDRRVRVERRSVDDHRAVRRDVDDLGLADWMTMTSLVSTTCVSTFCCSLVSSAPLSLAFFLIAGPRP